MARAKTPAPVEEAKEEGAAAALGSVEGHAPAVEQSVAVQPDAGPARTTLPQAPKQTSGNSVQIIGRIRDLLQHALYQRQPTAAVYLDAIANLETVQTNRAHPEVAAYKAEVIDYLRGKADALRS